jgi:hypothetical protein
LACTTPYTPHGVDRNSIIFTVFAYTQLHIPYINLLKPSGSFTYYPA